jgi:hypothetical protein
LGSNLIRFAILRVGGWESTKATLLVFVRVLKTYKDNTDHSHKEEPRMVL